MSLLTGTDGLIQIGPSNAPTTIAKITEITIELQTEVSEKGPYIGDATIYKVRKAKTSSGKFTADVPAARDSGQAKFIDLHETATDFRFVAKVDDGSAGYTYTSALTAVTGVTITGNAAEGWTIEGSLADMAGYTLVPST